MKIQFEKIYLHTPIRFLKSNKKEILLENCVWISISLKKKTKYKNLQIKGEKQKQMNTPKKKKNEKRNEKQQ